MKFKDLLHKYNRKMSVQLADILEPAIKEVYPNYYEGCKYQQWSNWKIATYMSNLDLDEKDLMRMIQISSRYASIWAFS